MTYVCVCALQQSFKAFICTRDREEVVVAPV